MLSSFEVEFIYKYQDTRSEDIDIRSLYNYKDEIVVL